MNDRLVSLPLLQDRIKNDSEAYKDEFSLQFEHFQSSFHLLALAPQRMDKNFIELVMFIANSVCFYKEYIPLVLNDLQNFLVQHSETLHSVTRKIIVKALLCLCTKKAVLLSRLMPLFLNLVTMSDKTQRRIIMNYVIRNISIHRLFKGQEKPILKNIFLEEMKPRNDVKRIKIVIRLAVELFRRNIWRDAALITNLTQILQSVKYPKITQILCNFLLGNYTPLHEQVDDTSDDDDQKVRNYITGAKKTRGRMNRLQREQHLQKRKEERQKRREEGINNFAGGQILDFIPNPQNLAEQLLVRANHQNQRDPFTIRLLLLNVVSRLIGRYELLVLPFYATIQKYINFRQSQITKVFAILAQGCHELVPPEELHPLTKCILTEFVAEYQTGEIISLGLHALRQICERAPLALTEEMLLDLCRFNRYKNPLVVAATRSLINLYRDIYPALLHHNLRGKTGAIEVAHQKDPRPEYGASCVHHSLKNLDLMNEMLKDVNGQESSNKETIEEQSNLSDSCISSDTLLDDEEFLEDDENEEAWELDSSKACCSHSQNDSDSNKDLNDDDRKDTDSTTPSTHLGETQQAAQPPPTINPLFDILTNEQHKQLTHIKQVQMLEDTERQQRLKELADDSSKDSNDNEFHDPSIVNPDDFKIQGKKKGRDYRLNLMKERKAEELSFTQKARLRSRMLKASVPTSVQKRNKPIMMVKHKRAIVAKRQADVATKLTHLRTHLKTLRKSTGKKRKYRRG